MKRTVAILTGMSATRANTVAVCSAFLVALLSLSLTTCTQRQDSNKQAPTQTSAQATGAQYTASLTYPPKECSTAEAQHLVEMYVETPDYGMSARNAAEWKSLRGNGFNIFSWAVWCEFPVAKPSEPKGQLQDYWLAEAVGKLIMATGDSHLRNREYNGDHDAAVYNIKHDLTDPDSSAKTLRLARALLAVTDQSPEAQSATPVASSAPKAPKWDAVVRAGTTKPTPNINWGGAPSSTPTSDINWGGAPAAPSSAQAPVAGHDCEEVDVSAVYHDGEVLALTDGRYLRVSGADVETSQRWQASVPFEGLICDAGDTFINKDDNESVDLQP